MRTAQVSILTSEVSTIDVSKRNEEKPMLNIDLGLAQGIEEGDHAVVYGDSEQWLGRAFCVQSDFNKSLWKFYRYDEKKKIIEAQQAVKLKGIPLSDGP